jgi:hypothetical protein
MYAFGEWVWLLYIFTQWRRLEEKGHKVMETMENRMESVSIFHGEMK